MPDGAIRGETPKDVLRRVFGFPEFRGLQEQAVSQVVAGGDALVLMPTGGGKSVCYQVPALVRHGVADRGVAADRPDGRPGGGASPIGRVGGRAALRSGAGGRLPRVPAL